MLALLDTFKHFLKYCNITQIILDQIATAILTNLLLPFPVTESALDETKQVVSNCTASDFTPCLYGI